MIRILPQYRIGEEAPVFTRDALLLIGHGSNGTQDAARPLLAHAEVIRASGRFAEVAVGMLRGEPTVEAAFAALTAPVVHVVPYFLEDGFFTRIAIPDLILPRAGERMVRSCQPVGLHPGMSELIGARLIRHCEMFGTAPKSLAVLVVGHGSQRNPGRARALRQHAERVDATRRFGVVRVAHLEETPMVLEALAGIRGYVVAVIGYLANAGQHATKDLPGQIAIERGLRGANWPPVHDLGSIGTDEALPRFLMDQVSGMTS